MGGQSRPGAGSFWQGRERLSHSVSAGVWPEHRAQTATPTTQPGIPGTGRGLATMRHPFPAGCLAGLAAPIFQTGKPRHTKVNGTCGVGLRAAGCGLSPPTDHGVHFRPGNQSKASTPRWKAEPPRWGSCPGVSLQGGWAVATGSTTGRAGATGSGIPQGWGSGGLTLVTRGLLLDHGQWGAGGRLAQGVAPALLDLHLQFGKRGRGLEVEAAACAEGPAARHRGARPIRAKWAARVPTRRCEAPGKGMAGSRGGHFR